MTNLEWRKSSRSGTGGVGGEDCVELAALPETVAIRDSKNPDLGHLTLTHRQLAHLITLAKTAALDLT